MQNNNSLICVVLLIGIFFCGCVEAQSKITLTTPHQLHRPANSLTYTTAELDQVVGAGQVTGLVNELFGSLADLKLELQSEVRQMLLANSRTKTVYWVRADIDPLQASLTQQGDRIGIELKTMDIEFKASASGGFFCPTVTYTATVPNIIAKGSYDPYSGLLQGPNVSHDELRIDASCSGLLGWLFDGIATNSIESATNSALDTALPGLAQTHQILSVYELLGYLQQLNISHPLLNTVVDKLTESIAYYGFNGGLALNIFLDQNRYGSGEHWIQIKGLLQTPNMYARKVSYGTLRMEFDQTYTDRVELYINNPSGWQYLYSVHTPGELIYFDSHLSLYGVAVSKSIPGLRSESQFVFKDLYYTCAIYCGGPNPVTSN